MSIKTLLKALIFYTCICTTAEAQIHLQDTLKLYGPLTAWLGKYLSYYEDKSKVINPPDIIPLLAKGKFIKCKNSLEFYAGRTNSNFWFVLPVKNMTDQLMPLFWSFNTSDLEFVLYDITDAGKLTFIDSASSHKPFSERSIPARGVTFRVTLDPHQTKLLLIKVYPLNIDYVNFPTNLTTVEDYFLWEKDYASSIFFYLGIFVIILLANICLGILLKAKIYLWHAAYIFAMILWNLNEFLFESLVLPEWLFQYYVKLPKVFFVLLSMILALTVFQVFTNQTAQHPKLFRAFQIYKGLAVVVEVTLFCSIFSKQYQLPAFEAAGKVGFFLGISGIGLLLLNIIIGFIKKEKFVMLYALITIFVILSILNNQLYEWFDVTLFEVYPNNLSVSVAVEIFLLTIVFAYSRRLEWEKAWKTNNELLVLKNNVSLRIIATQEEERKRIAQDLHDDLGGDLAGMKMKIQSLGLDSASNAMMMRIIDKASDNVRDISHNLMPPTFDAMSLEDLLWNFFNKLNRKESISFDFIASGKNGFLNNQQSLIIYRIVLELTNNIIRHSQAQKAVIQLIHHNDYLSLMAEDNGKGFVEKASDGIGLRSIRSRVDFLQGTINIDSGASGTTIIITIPYTCYAHSTK